MSTAPPPRRRQSARVYRRRRAVVLLGLLLVVAAVVLLIVQPWNGPTAPTPSASAPAATTTGAPGAEAAGDGSGGATESAEAPAGEPAPAATEPSAPVDGAGCDPAQLEVGAVTDASSYGSGSLPQLSLTLSNTGSNACTLNAGTTEQVFTITSGADTYWRSTDCQTGAVDQQILLEAGSTVTGAAITWDRTRSSPETCGGGRESVPAGGASYFLNVSVSGVASTEPKQFLLN